MGGYISIIEGRFNSQCSHFSNYYESRLSLATACRYRTNTVHYVTLHHQMRNSLNAIEVINI